MIYNIFIVIAAYLVGSIPSAVWIGKALHGIDVREHGSKNAGTTNVMRVLGVKTGLPVLLIDVFKGFGAAKLALLSPTFIAGTNTYVNFQLILGAAAVLGHVFPIFAGFRGGKGVATIVGVLLALHWQATLVAVGIFFLSLFITKISSVSSLMMGLSFPISVIFIFQSDSISLKIFSVIVCVLLFITHRKNISRLMKGEEGKATFLFKNADKKKE
ncbi:MAG: glycerol-3-phosphate 1-O-acyltransferase PlsY [Bacteroidales bacterium]|jgi:glycerol-3-phosphate acyltransferase PlsY|nr:glycerol-3-phosphate 1-O-acyltransferase PlsY [Bacteroidales bacterium]